MRHGVLITGLLLLLVSGATAQQHPPARNPIDRWNQMTPAERERELAKLPPERAKEIRERIRRYNQLPPDEKQALRERYQTFSQLPPERQKAVRQSMRDFRDLPAARRTAVRRAVSELRAMPEDERRARVTSEEFRSQFSPHERQIVENITENFADPPK